MMDNDELMSAILSRGVQVQKRRAEKRRQIVYGVCSGVCMVFLVLTATMLPKINETASAAVEQHYGSLILSTPYMGYVVIGLLTFVLGIFVTLLVNSLRNMHKPQQDE